jgi:hypothetical protein
VLVFVSSHLKSCELVSHLVPCGWVATCEACVQVIMAGRRRHFYLYDLAGSSVARVSNIAGISDSSLETFAVSPAGQVGQC